jgi:acyl-coenzyme A thioesterase PaaI-like protein
MPEMEWEALQVVLDQVESPYTVDEVKEQGDVRLRLPVANAHIRPGGTISGPALMAMADGTAWATVLSHRGPDMSPVSTSLHIDFLRKPDPVDLVADGVMLRRGRTLAVVDVSIRSAGTEKLVAKAQVTYAIPSNR